MTEQLLIKIGWLLGVLIVGTMACIVLHYCIYTYPQRRLTQEKDLAIIKYKGGKS